MRPADGQRRRFSPLAIAGIGGALLVVLSVTLIATLSVNKSKSEAASGTVQRDGTAPRTGGVKLTSALPPTFKHVPDPNCLPPVQQAPNEKDNHPIILLTNCNIWDGYGNKFNNRDLLLEGGVITEIGVGITPGAYSYETVDAEGRICTPGLVDMHNHLGVYAFFEDYHANDDGNEMTQPLTPMVRALDAIDPEDPAIAHIASGGITTAQVLPGSGNVMGGEAQVVKMRQGTVAGMLVREGRRGLKMACGENPKRYYGGMRQMPMTRMGSSWLMREKFDAARQLIEQQDAWCGPDAMGDNITPFPNDLSLEGLVGLLRGWADLHCHCYTVQDLEMVVRLADEFGFNITAFHHALEAWKIPEVLKNNNIGAATFSDLWGYKQEAWDASTLGPKILSEAGVKTALKSDHPVLDARTLMWEAAKAVYYGMSEDDALAAVTSVPAELLGLKGVVGGIAVGLDADIAVWNTNPFRLEALPWRVYIEGTEVYAMEEPVTQGPSTTPTPTAELSTSSECGTLSSYALTGVTLYDLDAGGTTGQANAKIIVQNGVVTCAGTGCSTPGGAAVLNVNGGIAIPGLINAGSDLGMLEIGAEEATHDGYISSSTNNNNHASVRAMDGVRVEGRHMDAALKAGVTTAVVSPQGSALIAGQGVAFTTYGTVIDDALVASRAGLHVHLGNDAKNSGMSASVSGQIAALRSILTNETTSSDDEAAEVIADVMAGNLPIVAHVGQAHVIASIVRLKRELGFELVIAGGAEAHVVADLLADNNVPVIVVRTIPHLFPTAKALDNTAALLDAAGVTVAIAVDDTDLVRNLRWDVGFSIANGLDWTKGLTAVTSTVADIFNLGPGVGRITVGQRANFVAFNGDPFTLQGKPQVVAVGENVVCQPAQL